MASVVPAQLLKVLTPADLDLRVNGLPTIDVGYLKVRVCVCVVSAGPET